MSYKLCTPLIHINFLELLGSGYPRRSFSISCKCELLFGLQILTLCKAPFHVPPYVNLWSPLSVRSEAAISHAQYSAEIWFQASGTVVLHSYALLGPLNQQQADCLWLFINTENILTFFFHIFFLKNCYLFIRVSFYRFFLAVTIFFSFSSQNTILHIKQRAVKI